MHTYKEDVPMEMKRLAGRGPAASFTRAATEDHGTDARAQGLPLSPPLSPPPAQPRGLPLSPPPPQPRGLPRLFSDTTASTLNSDRQLIAIMELGAKRPSQKKRKAMELAAMASGMHVFNGGGASMESVQRLRPRMNRTPAWTVNEDLAVWTVNGHQLPEYDTSAPR